jgi:hypothetical protein
MSESTEIEIGDEEDTGEGSSQSTPSQQQWKKWDYFDIFDEKTVKCKFCPKKLSAKSSSTVLKYHSNTHKAAQSGKITEFFKKSDKNKSFEDLLIEFIVEGNHPFAIVDERKFQALLKGLNPSIIIPSRPTIQSRCVDKMEALKPKIKEFIINAQSKISLTTDIWTSDYKHTPFAALTAHFFDKEFKLRHILLDFSYIPHPHSGEQIKDKVKETICEFEMAEKIIAITTDNAAANISGMKELQEELMVENPFLSGVHQRCFAHVLNLAVQKGIKVIKDIEKVRELIGFLNMSSKQLQLLEETAKNINADYLSPKGDVITRWNSTYEMIDRVLKLKPILTLLFIQNEDYKKKKFPENLWDTLENLRNLLEPFSEATHLISASEYPSLCIILPLYDNLIVHLNNFNSDKLDLKKCAETIKKKLSGYEKNIKSDLAIFAAMIDPRLKFEYFGDYENADLLKQNFLNFYEQNYKSQLSTQSSNENEGTVTFKESLYKKRKLNSSSDETKKLNNNRGLQN